jgi:hypothetical protein
VKAIHCAAFRVIASQVSAPVQHDDLSGANSKIRAPREANVRKGLLFVRSGFLEAHGRCSADRATAAFLIYQEPWIGIVWSILTPSCTAGYLRSLPLQAIAGGRSAQFCSGVVEKWCPRGDSN